MEVMRFVGPYEIDVIHRSDQPLGPTQVRVHTLYSGISAGTELTAYRGTNPYVSALWDPEAHLFEPSQDGSPPAYPLEGWGYSEVGRVTEVGQGVGTLGVGDVVWGIWGHRSDAVLEAEGLEGHVVPAGTDPVVGSFVRVAAIALNAVLAAQLAPGMVAVVLGQGIIGQLATRFARMNGATVYAIDAVADRRERARSIYGAADAFAPGHEVARRIRDLTEGLGADVAIELSGHPSALHEATRVVGPDGLVVASGFYQGGAQQLLLGQEFHHNRVTIRCSQIGAVPTHLAARWTRERLHLVAAQHLIAGDPEVTSLVTHRFALQEAPLAYRLLDRPTPDVLQVLFDFTQGE
jgi:threonine dehydrogenase-like Zn-dependent dehydrogenase